MAERPDPHYEETNDPHNPPNAVLNRDVRRAAVWVYVGPLVVLLIIVGIALLYWMGRGPVSQQDADSLNPAAGTTGEQTPGEERREQQQGGFEPAPRPDSTRDEVESRGGNDAR